VIGRLACYALDLEATVLKLVLCAFILAGVGAASDTFNLIQGNSQHSVGEKRVAMKPVTLESVAPLGFVENAAGLQATQWRAGEKRTCPNLTKLAAHSAI
jgi:hypothetical protein